MPTRDTATVLPRLAQVLPSRVPGLIAVYRFGSHGTQHERPDSDIDLGLQSTSPLDPVALFHLSGDLADLAGRDVDLVDMLTCSTVMRAQIISTGDRIYCSDAYRADNFANTAYSQYAYLNEARRGILQDIQATGSIHGR